MARWRVEKGLLSQKSARGAAICQALAEVLSCRASSRENTRFELSREHPGDTGGSEVAVSQILALPLTSWLIFGKLSSLSFSFVIRKMGKTHASLWEDL